MRHPTSVSMALCIHYSTGHPIQHNAFSTAQYVQHAGRSTSNELTYGCIDGIVRKEVNSTGCGGKEECQAHK